MGRSKKVLILILFFVMAFSFTVNAKCCLSWKTNIKTVWSCNFNRQPKYFSLRTKNDTYWCKNCLASHPFHYKEAEWTIDLPEEGTYTFYEINWNANQMVPDTDFKLMLDNNTIVSENSGSRGKYVNGGRYFQCSYTVDTSIHGKSINVSIQNDHFAEYQGKIYNIGGFHFDNKIRLYYTYTPPPNEAPSISILSPVHNQEFNRIQTDFRPQIRVYDADNDSLTCKYYVNSSSVPEDTKSVSGTSSAKVVTFDPLNMMGLSDGNHSLRFEVTDGEDTVEKTVSFRIVNSPPQINIIYPVKNAVFSEKDAAFVPQISVSDPNGDNLTCRYYIDAKAAPQDTRQISNTATAQTVSFNALDIAGLSQGERTLKFTVTDGKNTVEKTVSIKVDKTAPNLGTVSFASTDRSITVSGSATDTVSGMHASPYRYTVGTNVSGWTSHTSYTQDSLTPNTEYGVKFEARDNTNHIAVKEQAIYTKAQTPQLSVSNNGVATLQLNVTDNNPASTKYQIKAGSKYVTQTGALSAAPVWITLTNKRITVKGLAPNTTYALRAKAQNGAGIDTSWSSTVNGTSLANPPDHISAVPGQTDIKVSWNSISGALGYEIEVDGVVKNNGTSTHYTHSGLLPETSHRYRVRVKNAGGTGSWSSLTTAETLPYPPAKVQNIRCSDYTQTTIDLVWDSVPKASVYEVEANGQIIENGASTTFMHTGLIPETAYQYRVRGKNKGGDGQWSEPFTQATLPNPPAKPVGMNTVITKDSVTLSWAAVEKAEGYEVMADGLITDVGMETTYVHAGLAPLSGHTYKVRAVRAGGRVKGQWSDPIDVTTHPEAPVMPTNIMSTAEKTVLTVTWYQVPHAESYDVEIDGSTVVNVTDLMYIHRGLTPDTQHSYRIKAKNITGESEWSMPVKAFTLPESDDGTMALTNVVAVVTNTFITLSWDAAALDAEYDIEVDGVLQENGKETIYNHTGLNPNEYHTYKIRVKNSEGIARWCAVLSLSTLPNPPDAPTSIEAFAGDNSIELRWERVEGATGYDIEINGETVTGGADNRYIHQPLEPGTAHTYRVRAKNITGVTAWSPALVKSTTTPSYIVQCSQDKLFDLSLLADNVQDFTALAFTVTYDVNALEVADLYGATPQKGVIDKGNIPGTDIQVTHTPGKIVFTVDKHMIPGTSWSGELAAVVFKGKITGESEINFTVEEGQ